MNHQSSTAGYSYPYPLRSNYTNAASNSIPSYKSLSEYGACKDGGIISPTPTSTLPEIFYRNKPHSMPEKPIGFLSYNNYSFTHPKNENTKGDDFYMSIKNPSNYIPYTNISQGPEQFACNGYGYQLFDKGFNDVSRY